MITVYKFSAEWCSSCKSYDPIFDEVSKKFDKQNIEFKKIDIEESEELINKYSIKHVPMTIIDVNGEVKLKRVGLLSESVLTEEINKLI
jgi:thiol-disulfide isomerase/thioredoxin